MYSVCNLFHCLVFLVFSLTLFASSDSSRQYFEQDRDKYTLGAKEYLEVLPISCRYSSQYQKELNFVPDCFEIVVKRISPHCLQDVFYFRTGFTDFAGALDSLLTKPMAGKWIIDCTFATAFAELQGIRCIVDNDELFNSWCLDNLLLDEHGFLPYVKKTSLCMTQKQFDAEIRRMGSKYLPGAIVYLEQLNERDFFHLPEGTASEGVAEVDELLIAYPIYSAKHNFGSMLGLNTICLGAGEGRGKFVFFEDEGKPKTADIDGIAQMLFCAMNANVVSANIEERTRERLNSIRYKSETIAVREILRRVKISYLDFAAVRRSISVSAIKALIHKFRNDENFRAILLEACKAFLEKQQSTSK